MWVFECCGRGWVVVGGGGGGGVGLMGRVRFDFCSLKSLKFRD